MYSLENILFFYFLSESDFQNQIGSKKRVTLRGAMYHYYHVKAYANGCIILEPRELKVPNTIFALTLEDMDKAICNFKAGKASEPMDLSDF